MAVKCLICEKELGRINNLHLVRAHGITIAEYKTTFPNATTTSEEVRAKIKQNSKAAWSNPKSGLRNRRNSWETRDKNNTPRSMIKGKTYEEIYGKEKATELKALRKQSGYWKYITDEQRQQNRLLHLEKLRYDPEYRQRYLVNCSAATQRVWNRMTPEARNKRIHNIITATQRKPNAPEAYLQNLLQFLFPNEWAYVGNGELIIAGKNPDFANINGKKQLIELFGDFWHKGQSPQRRVKLFQNYGYETLVIWEHELYNTKSLVRKVTSFCRR